MINIKNITNINWYCSIHLKVLFSQYQVVVDLIFDCTSQVRLLTTFSNMSEKFITEFIIEEPHAMRALKFTLSSSL